VNFEEFFQEAEERNVRIAGDDGQPHKALLLSNEALFQLPLLAMAVLVISRGNRKPKQDQLGQLVGECLERSLAGFKGSSQHIGWSANLRIRTVKALTFLEMAGLVVPVTTSRTFSITDRGKEILSAAMDSDSHLARTLRVIERNYRNITTEYQIRLELP
jgi:predicted transcriptional regulator